MGGAEQPRDASSSRGLPGAVATPPDSAFTSPQVAANSPGVMAHPQAVGAEVPGDPIADSVPPAPVPLRRRLDGRARPRWSGCWTAHCLPPKPASSAGLPNELVRSKERAARAELMRAAVPVRRGVVHEGNEPLAPPARGSTSESAVSPARVAGQPSSDPGAKSRGETSAPSGTSPVPTGHRSEIAPADSEPETVVMQTGTSPALEVEPPRLDVSDGKVARAPDLPVATTASPSRPESPAEPSATSVAVPSSGSEGGSDPGQEVREGGASRVARTTAIPAIGTQVGNGPNAVGRATHEVEGAVPPGGDQSPRGSQPLNDRLRRRTATGARRLRGATHHPDGGPRRAGPEPVSARHRCGRLTSAGSD